VNGSFAQPGYQVLAGMPIMKSDMRPKRFKPFIIVLFTVFIIVQMVDMACSAPAPSITSPSPLPNGTEFVAYSYTFMLTGRVPPFAWSVTSGSLPSGLSLNESIGRISGTPVVSGSFTFRIRVTDAAGKHDDKNFDMTVHPACAFVGTSTGSISFNNIDPSTTPGPITNNSVTQQVLFRCDTTLTYSITTNPTNPSLRSGANSIPFTLGLAASGQNVTNTSQISLFTTASSILAANYQNAPAGSYTSGNLHITISWNGSSAGTITATATVTGAIINTCAVTQPSSMLTFSIDPSVGGTIPGVIAKDLKIKCTKNAAVAFSASSSCGSAPRLDSSYPACGGFQIPYNFNIRSGITANGFGPGTDIPLFVGGSVSSTNFADAPAGHYGDLQTVTITY
jgi:hypothetical protein